MINYIKFSVICGGTAFALAFVLSLLFGQTPFFIALIRALIFAAAFFGLGFGIRILINNYIPELLSSDTEEDGMANNVLLNNAGSRVNITVDDAPGPALPEQNNDESGLPEVGDFNELHLHPIKAADIDQNPENSYTNDQMEEFAPALDNISIDEPDGFSMDFGVFVPESPPGTGKEENTGIDDMDSFSFFPDEDESIAEAGEVTTSERKSSGNKATPLQGDFKAKEIAAGIRTALEKDKK